MPRGSGPALFAALIVTASGAPGVARADETSASDKLRILYSTRLSFTDDGVPLVTVEIMSGQTVVRVRAPGGVMVQPDGAGGAVVDTGAAAEVWTVTAEDARPAVITDWSVVETLAPDDTSGIAAALARWKGRGFEPRTFEIGTVFGVEGEVIDTREVRIALDPVAGGKGTARAAQIARRFGVATSVHPELVQRPSGTIVARSGATTIRNPSVLWFQPRRGSETIAVADVPTGTGGAQRATGREERRYRGAVYVTLDASGALVAVNAVAEDKLLAGLVPAEMYPDAPAAALEAQTIAARTELLQKIGRRNLTDPFLLCSSQQCQVYAGAGKEDPRTTRAVAATRGVVLLRDGGGLIDVRYSASCGGHSEDSDAIWGGAPDPSLRGRDDGPAHGPGGGSRGAGVAGTGGLPGGGVSAPGGGPAQGGGLRAAAVVGAGAGMRRVPGGGVSAARAGSSRGLGGGPDLGARGGPDRSSASGAMDGELTRVTDEHVGEFLAGARDAWCNQTRLGQAKFRWRETVTQAELTARVAAEHPEIGRVERLIARRRGVSGRITVLAIEGARGRVEIAGDLHIRRLLGGLKSTLFEIARHGDRFEFRGAGFGHGVGMCQMGAIGMASAGKSVAEILGFYFRGSHLHRLY